MVYCRLSIRRVAVRLRAQEKAASGLTNHGEVAFRVVGRVIGKARMCECASDFDFRKAALMDNEVIALPFMVEAVKHGHGVGGGAGIRVVGGADDPCSIRMSVKGRSTGRWRSSARTRRVR